jgi:DNA mismatch repair protein MutS2
LSTPLYQTLEFDKVLDDLARRTQCPVSAERLQHLKPLSSIELVRKRLARVSEARTLMDSGGSLPMVPFDDIGNYLKAAAIEGSRLDPKAFQSIHTVLKLSAQLHGFLKKNESDLPLLHEAAAGLSPNPDLVKEIDKAVDLRSLEIRDQASRSLAAIRRKMSQAREQVRSKLEDLLDRFARKGVLQERLITMRSGRWVLPVKETHRHLVKGVLHDKSASGATVFLEPLATLELNNQIRRLEVEEHHEIEKILRALTDLVRQGLPELKQNLEILVTLDSIHAMALTSKALNEHEPALNTDGVLKIKNGRHPLLLLKKGSLPDVVPLNLSVGEHFNTLVITGPNAGGKTVALKTVGLLTLMVSCGLHIPADADSQVALFKGIFAHVGDAQSIEMDLSTFSAHLMDIKAIMEEASSGDLVLIDEIGTGTDPEEGAALAMAVLEALTVRGTVSMVTTHHGALKAFAHRTPGIANGSMAFDTRTLTPTYQFRADIPGSSYALEMGKRMGLPEAVIARSKALMGNQADQLEDLILRLEERLERNKRLATDLKTERLVVDGLKKRFEENNARLEREKKQLRYQAVQEASAIIKQANATVEKAIRTIRETGATKEAIRKARALIQEEKEALERELGIATLDEDLRKAGQLLDGFLPGCAVYWKRTGAVGTVLSDKDPAGRVLIAFGKVKAHVPGEELSRANDIGASLTDPRSGVEIHVPEMVQREVDVRGMRVEEALTVVDKFLDDALLAGLKEVQIIHGTGTGALRKSLIPFLNQHPLVQATRPGGLHQENPGATIVDVATK